jgi:hypothetical protein
VGESALSAVERCPSKPSVSVSPFSDRRAHNPLKRSTHSEPTHRPHHHHRAGCSTLCSTASPRPALATGGARYPNLTCAGWTAADKGRGLKVGWTGPTLTRPSDGAVFARRTTSPPSSPSHLLQCSCSCSGRLNSRSLSHTLLSFLHQTQPTSPSLSLPPLHLSGRHFFCSTRPRLTTRPRSFALLDGHPQHLRTRPLGLGTPSVYPPPHDAPQSPTAHHDPAARCFGLAPIPVTSLDTPRGHAALSKLDVHISQHLEIGQ